MGEGGLLPHSCIDDSEAALWGEHTLQGATDLPSFRHPPGLSEATAGVDGASASVSAWAARDCLVQGHGGLRSCGVVGDLLRDLEAGQRQG